MSINVAIIGCGGIGRAHAGGFFEVPDAEIVAFVDLDVERAKELARRYNAKVCRNVDEIPDDVQAVSIATTPDSHYELTKICLKKGLHVFCEKPLTMDSRQARELVRLSESQGKVLVVGFKCRYELIFQKAKELLPKIGPIHGILSAKTQQYPVRAAGDWVGDIGVMYELSIHDIDMINWMVGTKPTSVYAVLRNRLGYKKEDQCYLTVEYEGGTTAEIMGIFTRGHSGWANDVLLSVIGENGYLRLERPSRVALKLENYEVIEISDSGINPFALELDNFIQAVQGKASPLVTGSDGYWATLIVESANASAAKGAPVVLADLSRDL